MGVVSEREQLRRLAPSAEIVEVVRGISGTSDSMLNLARPGADRLLS